MRDVPVHPASIRTALPAMLAFMALVQLAACGGDGAVAAPPPAPPPANPPPPPTPGNTVWTQGVYQPASSFSNRCEIVRTGVDIEGNGFPDIQGTALAERFWLRSWTNETYLWNTEVTDRNPASFPDKLQYFSLLRTFALTPSGKEKDDFHFSEPTATYLARRNAAPTATYGENLVVLRNTVPRDIRIRYTEPGSPAAAVVGGQPNLLRGTRILRINGMDLVNTNSMVELDAMVRALFPTTAGITTSFVVQNPGGGTRSVTLTSVNLSPTAVNRTSVIDTPSGKVGYILLNTFGTFASEQQLRDAFVQMQAEGLGDLVLDLRYNGGGLLAVASQLGYMVAGNNATAGRAFERLRFNASAGNLNPLTGGVNNPVPFFPTGAGFTVALGTPLPSLSLPRVFVLSTGETCSASEAVVNGLRGIGVEVILIGDTTCGKPFGFYPADNCGQTYYTIQFQGANDQNFGDYADGFIPHNSPSAFGVRLPGCQVTDDFSRELGSPDEALLSTALQYRVLGAAACPVATLALGKSEAAALESTATGAPFTLPHRSLMETSRDMTMPPGWQ